jgi:type VI protein secretion system component VasK
MPVDTLYFDGLQFLYHAALAVLVGGAIVLSAPSRRYDQLAGLALLVLLVTSLLKLIAFEDTDIGPRLVARWIALAVAAVATLYASAWASSVARSFRAQVPDFDDLPPNSPARREYAALGRSAARAMRVVVVSGLVALFFS